MPAEQLEPQALDRAHPLVLDGVPTSTGAAAHRGVRVDEQQQAREGARGIDEELARLVSLGLGLANPNPNPEPNPNPNPNPNPSPSPSPNPNPNRLRHHGRPLLCEG